MRPVILMLALVLIVAACDGSEPDVETTSTDATSLPGAPVETAVPTTAAPDGAAVSPGGGISQTGYSYPPAPPVADGPLSQQLMADLDVLFASLQTGIDPAVLGRIGESGDARVAWLLSDLLRFVPLGSGGAAAADAFEALTGADLSADPLSQRSPWQSVTNHLLAWELPEPPGYLDWKRIPFEIVEPAWQPFFDDENAAIDWRFVSWGGVLIDDRPLGDPNACPRGCIPALDDPAVTSAAAGSWYPDSSLVFGVVVNGEARAYPKNMMEVHEMVNDTVGGRRVAIPYCTLCGSAQAYYTDGIAGRVEPLVFRTSGLLSRSNKVMYELTTFSVFDTFLGTAVSGPLQDEAVQMEMASVVTSTWGDWKAEHPETTIVAQDGGIGRTYDDDPLGGRDANGPIFPVGAVDPRLPVQAQVLGVIAPDGTPLAFPVAAAQTALAEGVSVELGGVTVTADGSGVRAVTPAGEEIVSHQAFWFAWSQFQPTTAVWTSPADS